MPLSKELDTLNTAVSPHHDISSECSIFMWTGLRFIVYCLIIAVMVLCLTWEAQHSPHDTLFSERSLLEYLEEAVLLLTAFLCLIMARINPEKKALAYILAGAAFIAWIRELDFLLDAYVFDGAWQFFVIVSFAALCIKLYPLRHSMLPLISDFISQKSFGIIVSGFMTVFVFSRLFGRNVFWDAVMRENSMRAVKNAAEEGTELLGYLLIFIGILELLIESRTKNKNR